MQFLFVFRCDIYARNTDQTFLTFSNLPQEPGSSVPHVFRTLAEIAIETFSVLYSMHCNQFALCMFVCLSRISRAMIGRHKISVQIFKSNDSMTQNMLSSDWLQNFQYNQAYLLCLFLLIEVSFFGMRAGICSLNNTGLGLDSNLSLIHIPEPTRPY